MNGRAPLPLIAIALGGVTCLAGTQHPAVVATGLLGAVVLLAAAPRRTPRIALTATALMATGLLLLTPWVTSDGATVLVSGPPLAVIDTAVTAEELVWGAVVAGRLAAVVLLVLAVLAWIDQDRALDLLGRALPRSALMIGLAGRMLPALETDAATITQSARLRGVDLDHGGRLARARRAAPLVLPLTATALERGIDSAEALVARGFGAPGATRLPEAPLTPGEKVAGACGLALLALGALTIGGVTGSFTVFPRIGGLGDPAALGAAAALALALTIPARVLSR